MRDIIFITKEPMDIEICKKLMSQKINNLRVFEHQLSFGNAPNSFYLFFPSGSIDDPDEMFEEDEKKLVPFDNAKVIHAEYHASKVVKKVVTLLAPAYPEMIIVEDGDNFFSVEEFLKAEFDH